MHTEILVGENSRWNYWWNFWLKTPARSSKGIHSESPTLTSGIISAIICGEVPEDIHKATPRGLLVEFLEDSLIHLLKQFSVNF